MQPKWLLEKEVFEESEDMIKEIHSQGMEAHCISSLDPFSGKLIDNQIESCIIVRGSLNLVRQLQREQPQWIPGGWCNLDNFKCSKYFTYYGEHLINKDYTMMPLQEVLRQKDLVLKTFGKDGKIFVRPDSGFKYFTGKVLNADEINLEGFEYGFYYEDLSTMVVISSPKNIQAEWRFVVAEKEVISGCIYQSQNIGIKEAESYTDAARNYAKKIVLQDWQPEIIYTIDICLSDKQLYVLELNAFSTSGLYVCDLKPIVKKASELAIMEWNEMHP